MRFLTYDELKTKGISYSRPHLWRLIRAGKFPPPIKGLGQQNVWSEPDVDAVVAERIAAAGKAKILEGRISKNPTAHTVGFLYVRCGRGNRRSRK